METLTLVCRDCGGRLGQAHSDLACSVEAFHVIAEDIADGNTNVRLGDCITYANWIR